MLRRDFPPIIDGVTISIEKGTWDRYYGNVININSTEAGTDDVEVLRSGKLTISASFSVSDRWAAILAGFNSVASFTVKDYDPITKTYGEYTMRMENLSIAEVELSDRLEQTNGLYDISFNLVEF